MRHSFDWTATEVPAHVAPDTDVRRDIVSWLATAQPTEVRALMEWNVAEQHIMQADLEARLPALQERTTRAIARLVCEGSLPHAALKAYRQAVEETHEVHALDAIAVGEDRCDGIYYLGRKVMGINGSTLYLPDDEPYPTLEACVLHEYGHGAEAMGYDGLRGVGATTQPRWLIEAFNEHVTQAGLFGNFNVVSPTAHNRSSTYRSARLLLSALLNAGDISISPRVLGREAFRPHDPSSGYSYVRDLIDQSFQDVHAGPDSLVDRISRQYDDATTKADEHRIMEHWYDKITQQVGYNGLSAAALIAA